ncbi:peptidoglycan-binding protein [Clostridium aminobutyricum]|uniref:Peptidoglycan-binding protein n=1 Tax=Clostridium aminobutyricum TaxID=33953 RepID=A0A939IJW7_CLOAM|nr:peptidoglycan-binding protein [Clostridium aminobutyricum]MBN7774536.1 peptidoglycan-binding protein [Clostridium aminobutyricum]
MRNHFRFKRQLSDQGRLQVNAFALDVGKPASDASVVITSRDTNEVVDELMTDSSGQSAIIDLSAPPVDFSLEPESEVQPYSEYDVSVNLEGYEPVRLDGVQILSSTTALQNVNLRPIVRDEVQPQDIVIDPHTLWGIFPPKIPEDEVKPLPESVGFVVLPQPVIPEFVIVHEGVPTNTSARNLWIPFKDYIKNVASCEIYSTWPGASIRANVLAILSFTLNRIYTEWYRGKGFDFTITNSTAFDQAFTYGRNIYQEISLIVDELFTNFITRPDIRQPLLTQYCDGSRVRCPNMMEQWGSKTLADQGYDAIGILRYYYGQDIFLMQAEKVAGVPISYPGTALQMGSTGPSVRTIQEQLNTISNNYPAINKIRVDGVFGDQTRTAVETFQRIFNLPATGIVDFGTWYQISNIYVAVTKMAELA